MKSTALVLLVIAACGDDVAAPPPAAPVAKPSVQTSQHCMDVRADYNWVQNWSSLTGLAGSGGSAVLVKQMLDDIVNKNWECFH